MREDLTQLSTDEIKQRYKHANKVCNIYKNCTDGSYGAAADDLRIHELRTILQDRGVHPDEA